MATNKNITMKQFNGTDYDTLYPKTIASQVDNVYNKEEVISGATKSLYGVGSSATPDDVFSVIKTLINNANANANSKAKIATGSYVGTGTYGESNPNTLTFDFAPKLLWFVAYYTPSTNQVSQFISCYILSSDALTTTMSKYQFTGNNSHADYSYASKSSDGKTFSWYNTEGYDQQFNTQGIKYYWLILG